ncbi:MAG: ABC transporter substrate binding protein [Gammaproteobacteria bacterium]
MALPKFLFLFLFLFPFLAPPSAHAAERLLVLLSGDSWAYTRVEQALVRSLNPQVRNSLRVTVATVGDTDGAPQPDDSLVVAVGVRAAAQALQSSRPTPVLCVLVPQITFDMLRRVYTGDSGRPVSAIYLDQPMGRQLDLVRLTVPTLQQVGVLLGPNSRMARKTLESAAHARGISVHIGEIGPDDNPIAALTSVLDDSDALLAEPDPVVFNRGNLEGILLSTYRMSIPVIGFSHAYVQAGALAAVYSTPEQIGRQAGELISRMARLGRWQLPKPSYPAYYTVTVNRQVARSLRLDVPTGQQLQAELEKLERRQ